MRRVLTGLYAIALMAAGTLLLTSVVMADGQKTDICHKGRIINVATAAVPAHLAHGDNVEVCGDGVDNDCDGDTDCADNECDGQTCGSTAVCDSGACEPCGELDLPCCASGLPCLAPTIACAGSTSTCEPCGHLGGPCCYGEPECLDVGTTCTLTINDVTCEEDIN